MLCAQVRPGVFLGFSLEECLR